MTRTTVATWMQRAELLYLLVRKELKIRYKSRFLGYLWALANPLAFSLVYWIAFKFIMRVEMENYSLYLICGMFPWVWMNTGIANGTRSFLGNASLIKKAKLPRAILPLSSVAQETVHFVFALPVIIAFVVFAGNHAVNPNWLWQIPLLIVLQVAFVYPLALALAVTNVYVRDIEYLVTIGFSLLFFATPMVYPVTMVPEAYRHWFELNPLHALMQSWRSTLLTGNLDPYYVGYTAAVSVVMSIACWMLYRRFAPRIGELI
jgi:lipopolysaccharide transport system permease protein